MRASVAVRGVAASTFEHVSREARVSRGLLHYYFGTKERLLAEAVRRECDLRLTALDERLAAASSARDVVALLRDSLEEAVREDPELFTLVFELFTLGRRNPEVAEAFADLLARTRERVAALLRAKEAEGVIVLRASPEAIGELLFSLADGIALRMLGEPGRDATATVEAAVVAVGALLGEG